MYVLTILHGASMIVQKPMFFIYFVGPAVLFTIDKVVSLSRKRMEISIVKAENLASGICNNQQSKRKSRESHHSIRCSFTTNFQIIVVLLFLLVRGEISAFFLYIVIFFLRLKRCCYFNRRYVYRVQAATKVWVQIRAVGSHSVPSSWTEWVSPVHPDICSSWRHLVCTCTCIRTVDLCFKEYFWPGSSQRCTISEGE